MTLGLVRWQAGVDRASRWAAIALGFSIPISVALDNLLLALLAALFVLGGRYRDKLARIRSNPVAVAAALLYAMFLVGAFYGQGTAADARLYLGKYVDLVFIGVLLPVFADPATRGRALLAIGAAMLVTLVGSYLGVLGVLHGRPENPALIFKGWITQNLFLAVFAFALLVYAQGQVGRRMRWLLRAIALCAVADVLFYGRGRTGYMAVIVLALYLFFVLARWRGVLAVTLAALLIGVFSAVVPNSLSARIGQAISEVRQWRPGGEATTSMGIRLDFYYNSLNIIRAHPLLGVGTGGFEAAYARADKDKSAAPVPNPHNEYFLVTGQQGLVGLALLIALFLTQWRSATKLGDRNATLVARGVVLAMASGCLFNSFLLDHTEGLAFAWMSALLFSALPATRR
ncbi:MAG: O-antigen ligase family protein [Burkholderiales bacterium]